MFEAIIQFIQNNPLDVVASTLAIVALIQTHRQAKLSRQIKERATDLERRQRMVEVDNKLHDAWLLLGGDIESETINKTPSKKDMNEAKRIIMAAEKLAPKYGVVHRHWAQFYYWKKNFNKAKEYAEKAVTLDGEDVSNLNILSVVFSQLGDDDKAIKLLIKAIEKDPDYMLGYFNIGISYNEIGEYEKAREYLLKGLEIDDEYDPIYSSIAWGYSQERKHKEALRYLQKAIKINPDDMGHFDDAAMQLLDLDRFEEAIQMLEVPLQKDPENTETLDRMGWIYTHMDEFDTARKYFERSIAVDSESSRPYHFMAINYFKQGNFEKSQEYIDLAPSNVSDTEPLKEQIENITTELAKHLSESNNG